MAKYSRTVGVTSQIFQVFIQDSSSTTGAGLPGLAFNTASLTAYYHRDTDTTATAITLVTMTVGTFTSSGFKEIDATNMPGWYQICPPNACFAVGAKNIGIHLKGATNMAPLSIEIDLDAQVDVTFWNGTAVASPATAGIPDVNAKNINNVATTSVTTINANVGTTQPTNYTGTGGSALVKSDTVDIDGAAVSTTSAQIGTNVVSINAVSAASVTAVNANQGTTQPLNFTGTGASALVKGDMVDVAGAAVSTSTAQIGVNVVNWGGTATNGAIPPDVLFIRSGTAQGGGASTITLDAGASATNNLYNNATVFIRSGTGVGQTNIIASYVGATKVATMANAWATAPDNTSVFTVFAGGPSIASVSGTVSANVTQWNGTNVASPNVAGVPLVDVGYTKGTVSAGAAGSVGIDWGQVVNKTTTNALTGTTISTSQVVASVSGAVGSVTGSVGGNVTGSVGSVAGNVSGSVGSVVAAVTVGAYSAGQDPFSLVWNATDGLETGVTTLQGLRYTASASAGVLSGATTTTVAIQAIGNAATNRITATVDANGNRSAVALS